MRRHVISQSTKIDNMYPSTKQSIPTMEQYQAELRRLSTNLRALVMLRLAAETGMTRIEIASIKKENLDRSRRELYLHRSKAVKRKKDGKIVYVERNRHVPINASLMPLLLAYVDSHDSPYIFNQSHHYKVIHPMLPEAINALFIKWEIPWSPHKFRHFFKQQVKDWMIKERQVDTEVIKEIMGHEMNIHESYGANTLEYKLRIVDGTFS